MPCSLLKVNQRFRGTYHLHLQAWRISQVGDQSESSGQAELVSCSAYSTLKTEVTCSLKCQVTFSGLQGIIIPEDVTPRNHCHENHKFYLSLGVWKFGLCTQFHLLWHLMNMSKVYYPYASLHMFSGHHQCQVYLSVCSDANKYFQDLRSPPTSADWPFYSTVWTLRH
jgi:hypothetical protein